MTDSHRKRRFAGMRVQEKRLIDQDPLRVPPHKKPRKYRLEIEWTEVQTIRYTQEFTSKDAREQAKIRMAREIAAKRSPTWTGWIYERLFRVRNGPVFNESLLD